MQQRTPRPPIINSTRFVEVTCETCGHSYDARTDYGPLDGAPECTFCDMGGHVENCIDYECEVCERITALVNLCKGVSEAATAAFSEQLAAT
jgi:hypothetical protein